MAGWKSQAEAWGELSGVEMQRPIADALRSCFRANLSGSQICVAGAALVFAICSIARGKLAEESDGKLEAPIAGCTDARWLLKAASVQMRLPPTSLHLHAILPQQD